jgi:IclR family acetate operon transcriptional repressor
MIEGASRTEGGETARRALRLLEAVARDSVPVGLADLCTATGLNRSVAYRLMRVLQEEAYVERVDTGYQSGPALVGLAVSALPQLGSYAEARPLMAALANRTGETVTLHRRMGDSVVLVQAVESTEYNLRHVARVGEALPIVRGCSAQAILAHLPADEQVDVIRRNIARTDVDADELSAQLRRVRERGWAYSDRANHEAISGLAAPLPLARDQRAHSLCISGPNNRLTFEVAEKIAPMLFAACDQVAEVLRAPVDPSWSGRLNVAEPLQP